MEGMTIAKRSFPTTGLNDDPTVYFSFCLGGDTWSEWLTVTQLIPRMLRPTTNRDTRIKLFGEEYDTPILFSPVGVQCLFNEDKETGVAQIAAEIGVPYILSTAASSTIEEVAKASANGKRWFQLYWPHDDDVTVSVSLGQSM